MYLVWFVIIVFIRELLCWYFFKTTKISKIVFVVISWIYAVNKNDLCTLKNLFDGEREGGKGRGGERAILCVLMECLEKWSIRKQFLYSLIWFVSLFISILMVGKPNKGKNPRLCKFLHHHKHYDMYFFVSYHFFGFCSAENESLYPLG